MARLIDADALKAKAHADPDSGGRVCMGARYSEAPTVDAVEVVRCKDCRFSAQHDPYDPMECMKWTTKWGVAYTTPDGHCHKGERKKVNLEDIVDLDAQTKANNEAMRKVIDFMAGGADNEKPD